jgi:hypothetical protein
MLSFSTADMFFVKENSTAVAGEYNITGSYDVTVYAQNPSATDWFGPGALGWDTAIAAGTVAPDLTSFTGQWHALGID